MLPYSNFFQDAQRPPGEWCERITGIAELDENLVARERAEKATEKRRLRAGGLREVVGGAWPISQLLWQSEPGRGARDPDDARPDIPVSILVIWVARVYATA